jgi:hypothetical protein
MPQQHRYDTESHENGVQVRAVCPCGWKGNWHLFSRRDWEDDALREWNRHTEEPSQAPEGSGHS